MNGVDCATKLTATSATALKKASIDAVGRYLGGNYALTVDEVKAIQSAGLALWLIYETNPTRNSYFSYNQGVTDARNAVALAEALGVPQDGSTAIYFTVDYDAQTTDISYIEAYISGIRNTLGSKYLLGIYGSFTVVTSVKADRYFQTYAWSGGKQALNNDIYQYSNGVTVAGVSVDQDNVSSDAGLWGVIKMFNNLIIYQEGPDKRAAEVLADFMKAPIVSTDNITDDLSSCATNKYKVGGSAYPGAHLISGSNRFLTMKAVLQVTKTI